MEGVRGGEGGDEGSRDASEVCRANLFSVPWALVIFTIDAMVNDSWQIWPVASKGIVDIANEILQRPVEFQI